MRCHTPQLVRTACLLVVSVACGSPGTQPSLPSPASPAQYTIGGVAGSRAAFRVDNVLRVTVDGGRIGDFGNVPGQVGPVDFQATPGRGLTLEFYDDGLERQLDPLVLYRNGTRVLDLHGGIPYSCCTPCCGPYPGTIVFSQQYILP